MARLASKSIEYLLGGPVDYLDNAIDVGINKSATYGKFSPGASDEVHFREKYAVASGITYVYDKSGLKTAQALADKLIPGYQIQQAFSSSEHVCFKNDKTKHIIVAYRGTDPTKFDDLRADHQIITSGNDLSGRPRFERASESFDTIRQNFGTGYTYSLTGHSLGGTQAMHVAKQHPTVQAYVYNPGVVTPNVGQAWAQAFKGNFSNQRFQATPDIDNVEIMRVDGDVVSHGSWRLAGLQGMNSDGGARIVNVSYANEPGKMLSTTLRKHELTNFMSEETAKTFRVAAGLSEDEFVYGKDPTKPEIPGEDHTTLSEETLANIAVGSHGEIHHHTRRGNRAISDMNFNNHRFGVMEQAEAWAQRTGNDPGDYWYHLHTSGEEADRHRKMHEDNTSEALFNAAVKTANGPVLELGVPMGFASQAADTVRLPSKRDRGFLHLYTAKDESEDHRVSTAPNLRQVPTVHKQGTFVQKSAANVDHVHTMAPVQRAPEGSHGAVDIHHHSVRDEQTPPAAPVRRHHYLHNPPLSAKQQSALNPSTTHHQRFR